MRTYHLPGAIFAVAALLLTTSACGAADKPEVKLGAEATKSASASASPSTEAAAAKPKAPLATTNTSAGRVAFAKYFVKAYQYAYGANDASLVTAIGSQASSHECTSCTDLATFIGKQRASGLHLEPYAFPVRNALETARATKDVWIVDVIADAPARADVDAAGTKVNTYPAKKNFLYEVGVTWEDGAYRVTGWKAGENK